MLERQHLQIIHSLGKRGSLSAAAEELCLTQSALSHAIRKMENHYGVSVWRKKGRGVELTQAGVYLLAVSQRLLPELKRADEALVAFGEGKQGKLKIGMECHPCYEWLMSIVSPFLSKWPRVDLDVIQEFRFDGLGALLNSNIDVLITSDPIEKPELVNRPVLDYELTLVTSVAHSLAQRDFIEPGDLNKENLICFPVEQSRLDVFTRFLIPGECAPKSVQSVETIEVMLQLVACHRGVCTLPKWLLPKYMETYDIEGVRLGRAGVHKTLYLVYRKMDECFAYIQDFVKMGSQLPIK